MKGPGDRKEKLGKLSLLLRGFLDTEALARLAAAKHLEGRSEAEVKEFLGLFHEFFVRTYVQRLLLFDAPNFGYGEEKVTGDDARVATEVITPGDRFAVDYVMHRTAQGWRATDINVEGVSLARNFRSQFDSAVAREGSSRDCWSAYARRCRAAPATSPDRMLAVFRKDLRIFLRDRSALVFSLADAGPGHHRIAAGLSHNESKTKRLIPIVNEDKGPVATTFIKLLGEHADRAGGQPRGGHPPRARHPRGGGGHGLPAPAEQAVPAGAQRARSCSSPTPPRAPTCRPSRCSSS